MRMPSTSTSRQRAGRRRAQRGRAGGKAGARKFFKKKLAFLGACVLLIGLALTVYFYPVLKVSKIEVNGAFHAKAQTIEEASGVAVGENIFRVDTAAAAGAVAQQAWVEKVNVSRSWPTTVRIDVTEHDPVGVLRGGRGDDDTSESQVVDEAGRIFLRGVEPDGAVPFERIDPEDSAALAAASEAVGALPEEVRGQLERVEAQTAESVVLFFAGEREVFWGANERVEAKAEATRVVLQREGARWNVSNPAMPSTKL